MWVVVLVFMAFVVKCDAHNAFLKGNPFSSVWLKDEELHGLLREETSRAFGEGFDDNKLFRFESQLRPMYDSLPKNSFGKLERSAARYALHRLFVARHGWVVKGLELDGVWNASSPTEVLQGRVPARVSELFEERLGAHGLGLHELATIATILEHLVLDEVRNRVEAVFYSQRLTVDSSVERGSLDVLLQAYMVAYIFGIPPRDMTPGSLKQMVRHIKSVYPNWPDVEMFLRDTRQTIDYMNRERANHFSLPTMGFHDVMNYVEIISDNFGKFQNSECMRLKDDLLEREVGETGRVRLADFYRSAINGVDHHETIDSLRELGALDESAANGPHVIIPNYIQSSTNCILSTTLYSVCCMNECEMLLSEVEKKVGAPEASPQQIVDIVSSLASSTVDAPRNLSSLHVERLNEIADEHWGSIPLHSRLFFQWMHHVYPRECPYPHKSGTTASQHVSEWTEDVARGATEEEKIAIMSNHSTTPENYEGDLQWTRYDELLIPKRIVKKKMVHEMLSKVVLAATLLTFALHLRQVANRYFNEFSDKATKSSLDKFV